jgi:hypothetical protein
MHALNEIAALTEHRNRQCVPKAGKINIDFFKIELARGTTRSRDRPPTFRGKPNAPAGFVFAI